MGGCVAGLYWAPGRLLDASPPPPPVPPRRRASPQTPARSRLLEGSCHVGHPGHPGHRGLRPHHDRGVPRALRARPTSDAPRRSRPRRSGAAVLRLQRAYGNQAVQRLLPRAGGAGPGRGPRVQRWHDAEHNSSTKAGLARSGEGPRLAEIFGGRAERTTRTTTLRRRWPPLGGRLGEHGPRLPPNKKGRESHSIGRLPTLVPFAASLVTGTMKRGANELNKMISGAPQTPCQLGTPYPRAAPSARERTTPSSATTSWTRVRPPRATWRGRTSSSPRASTRSTGETSRRR